MERRPGHLARLVWAGTIALLVLVWIASAWWSVKWTNQQVEAGIGNGQLWVYARQENWPPAQMGWTIGRTSEPFRWFVYPEPKYFRCLFLPLWAGPVSLIGTGMWIRWRGKRRRRKPAVLYLRARAWRLLKRCAVVVTVLLLVVSLFSIGRNFVWMSTQATSVEVTGGALVFCRTESKSRISPGLQIMLPRKDANEWWWQGRGTGYEVMIVRIALIAAIPAAVAMGAWWMERYVVRARRGACGACGYSRAGIETSAPCPECGEAGARA